MQATLLGGPLNGRELVVSDAAASIHVPYVSDITGAIFIVKYDRMPQGYVWRNWDRAKRRHRAMNAGDRHPSTGIGPV